MEQLTYLEDSSEPVIYSDFATATAEMPEYVFTLYTAVQEPAENIGILGFESNSRTYYILETDKRSQETVWDEKVHQGIIIEALATSKYTTDLDIANLYNALFLD
ncbi:MAG: hypothetical protein Q9219_005299 [cf. Caloplaca sp. 3 TL-2023]